MSYNFNLGPLNIHEGSWLGLPDLGITEVIGDAIGANRTSQGGSNIIGSIENAIAAPAVLQAQQNLAQAQGPMSTAKNNFQNIPTGGNPVQTQPTNNTAPSASQNTGLDPHINPATGLWDDNYYAATHRDNFDISAQVDALYNPSFDYLNQAEANLRSDYPGVVSGIESNYNVNKQELENQNQSSIGQLESQKGSAYNQKVDALSAARRVYDELRRGYQQRFGGSTSAGQAATELSSVEQQRQMGLTQRQYGDLISQINMKRADLDRAFSTANLRLKTDTDNAKQQAWSDFQSKLLDIQNNKANIASAKAAQSLQLLQDYRNKVFSINQQNLQFQQNLELSKLNATSTLNAWTQQQQQSMSAVQNAYNQAMQSAGFSTNPQSSLTASNPYTVQTPQMTGLITGKTFIGYDANGKPIFI